MTFPLSQKTPLIDETPLDVEPRVKMKVWSETNAVPSIQIIKDT